MKHPQLRRLRGATPFRKNAGAVAVIAALAGFVSVPACAAEPVAAVRQYSIPAGQLADVLAQYAASAGVQLVVDPVVVDKGRVSKGLKGTYSVQGGFAALLAGTGVEVFQRGDGSYALRAVPLVNRSGDAQLAPVTVTAGGGANVGAFAQESGYRAKRSSASGYRQKAVLDTPFSVATIPAEAIRDQQARSLLEVTKNDPSVVSQNSPLWYDRVSVRGFGLGHDSYHREGFSANDQAQMAMENKATVEILKGLSALRYGSVSPGGVINYVVKRPTSQPLAQVNVYGNGFGGKGIHGDFGGRFGHNEQFGVRVNVAAEDVHTHNDKIHGDKQFVSAFLDWQATDKLLLEFDFEHQAREVTGYSGLSVSSFQNINVAKAVFSRLKADTTSAETWSKAPTTQTYYGGALHYQLADQWKVKLAAQQQYLNMDQHSVRARNIDANGNYDVFLYYAPDQDRPYSGWQAIVEGDITTGVLKHELAFGVDGTRRDLLYPTAFNQQIGTDNLFARTGTARPAVTINPANNLVRYDQSSRFLTDTISYSDWLQVYLGVRHTELKSFSRNTVGVKSGIYEQTAVNPTLGFVIKPVQNLSLYTSYAEGIEQGGIAPTTTVNANEVMKPLESNQYEIGAKYELPHGAMLSAAYFHIDKGLEYTDSSNRYVQDGRQVHKGVELALSGQLSSKLRAIAGVAYLDAKVEKTANAALIGKTPINVPKWQANLFVDYDMSALASGLSANAGVYYSSKKAIDALNTWMAESYTRLDVGLRYQQRLANGQAVTYRLNVENLTDKEYLANTAFGALDFGAPRTIKGAVEVAF